MITSRQFQSLCYIHACLEVVLSVITSRLLGVTALASCGLEVVLSVITSRHNDDNLLR